MLLNGLQRPIPTGCFYRQLQILTNEICMRVDGSGKELKAASISFFDTLKACIKHKDLSRGIVLHAEICKHGLLEKLPYLGNSLITMYTKCGALQRAREVLFTHPDRDVVSWSALIAGYAQNGQGEAALDCYALMQKEGLHPDAVTYVCILKACSIAQESELGKAIHDEINYLGLLEKNPILGTALVDMYAKCGLLMRAREVHNELSLQTIASWNALIAGYTHQGKCTEALDCYACMRNHGFTPNSITYACILKACGITQQVNIGKAIHDEIAPKGFLAKDIVLGTAVVDMYAKCGLMMKAEEVLEDLFPRDVVSWNALILGYIQNGPVKKAFECFSKLQNEGLSPNATTHACILKACGILGERKIGEQIHNELVGQGLLKRDVVLGNALVDMYSRCGMLSKAESMLETLRLRNVATWNALITGYADQGRSEDALKCFMSMQTHNINPDIVSWNALLGGYAHQGLADEALHSFELMQSNGMDPDPTTFVCILNACSHSGLVDKGEMCYENMITAYGLMPVIEHYVCMVDLFGRSGDMDMARVVVEIMPICDDHRAWDALLGACRKWGNKRLGKLAFDHALLVNDGDAIAHVCMENICITAATREDE